MQMNEYRLNGMAHWCRYGQSMRWDGEALRLQYRTDPGPTPYPAKLSDEPVTVSSFYYRLVVTTFYSDDREYRINEIEMQLQDQTWEVIERVINAR